jgi:23S rRNA (uracil1939-C5)-methyltransferase
MKIAPYNEDRRTGIIRFVLIKEGFQSKQVLVVIDTNGELFPGRNEFVKQLRNRFPEITSIIQNYNSRQTSIILGDQERVLYGPGYIEDSLLGLKFKISSKTFFQVNPAQTKKLYSKVREFADFNQTETIIDAYCGVGTIGMVLSRDVKHVIGVESNRQSVQNANANMKDNKIANIQFINEDATEFLGKLAKDGEKIDAVIMDPPRSGSTEKFLNSIMRLSPQKIIYVSCEAKTLARDLKSLIGNYKISKTAIVDMFPGTYHVETVVLMSRADK